MGMRLHEVLAAEKTRVAAWNTVVAETLKKFGSPHFFEGHIKTLKMIEDNPANSVLEDQAREDKPVITTVYATLHYLLKLYGRLEDLQLHKNATNRAALGTVLWEGQPLLEDMPVDQLLGLEARLSKLREVIVAIPTLDASRKWRRSSAAGPHGWVTEDPEETTKTEKQLIPVILIESTKEHPAQVQPMQKDVVVGKFTTIRHSGAATAMQKAESIQLIDSLIVEIKQARMRANETEVVVGTISDDLVSLILEPFLGT